ncbi:hypothetical protein HPB49_025321 [Dermacentor silvarum]|uniref:Uncharacterized protein n=1 Tax=Dermacentor silvarum TaxID=543639 RepID=A0ACB8CIP0_DERSI|nr:hypothetical protein HPB49_025321 [Dermacentor silvarum]
MLRNADTATVHKLLELINKHWQDGYLPKHWKHSAVIPIPKPGKQPTQICNMRPVSLTPTISKLMVKMVTTRFYRHLERCRYFHPFQTGFRPQLGTQDSLYLLHTTINRERKFCKGRPDTPVAVHLKKAFHTIGDPAIIKAVESTQAGTRLVNFVKAFLKDRTYQFLLSPGHLARHFTSSVGIPRGSVISPTLFNVVMAKIAWKLDQFKTFGLQCTLMMSPCGRPICSVHLNK